MKEDYMKSSNLGTMYRLSFTCAYTKAKEGNNWIIYYNDRWDNKKRIPNKQLLGEKETGKIYDKLKIDVERVFGFLKAHLCFTRFSVRSKERNENELGFAFMEVNIRKLTSRAASISTDFKNKGSKKISVTIFLVTEILFCVRD